MNRHRTDILQWVAQQRLHRQDLPAALRLAGVVPGRGDWRRFLDRLALWLGATFLATGVIFFFAYNWAAMGRFAKFGLVETLLLAAVVVGWRLGPDRLAGKATLLVATLLTGALLALLGQTYQTGADPWQLFAVWALLVLPWVAAGRFGPLWLLWLCLLNLATALYHQTFGGLLFNLLFSTEALLWTLFALDTAALAVWEFAARREIDWLQERWSPRVLATASGGLITALAVWTVVDFHRSGIFALLGYAGWIAAAYAFYRHRQRDLFVLAGGVLSVIILVTAVLSRIFLAHGAEAGGFLFIGLVVIGLSAAGGYWLKTVAAEEGA